MPDFNFKEGSFPMAAVINAAQQNNALQQKAKQDNQKLLLDGIEGIGIAGKTILDRKQKIAQALALGRQFDIPEDQAKMMSPEQVLDVGKATMPIAVPYMDKDGQIQILSVPKGSKGLPSQGTPPKPQQSQYVDPSDGTPLNFLNGTYVRSDGGGSSRGTPTLKKGDESAVTDATLLSNQIPNIKPMFDAYRNSKNPRLQSTPAGRLLDPSGKQAENALKLAAFTFGGKNLTGQEKDVVFGALFPSWTDNEASRDQKEQLLSDFMTGKIDLLQAANLLGGSGVKLKQMLAAKMAQQGASNPQAQSQPQSNSAPSPAPAESKAPSDLVHLSTKELMDLRKKMTAHKEKDNGTSNSKP